MRSGEDPYIASAYATYFVRGFQESPDDGGKLLQASANCKHFVANSMDTSTAAGYENDRHHFDATVSERDLADVRACHRFQ